jgi:signal transduction histidine kinase
MSPVEYAPALLSAELSSNEFEWLSGACELVALARGEALHAEGDLADHFYILTEGELRGFPHTGEPCLFSRVQGQSPLLIGSVYLTSIEATSSCRLMRIGADAYLERTASQSPANGVLVTGLIWRFRTTESILHQTEKLASLGKLAAGLTHELNNPAAAGRRAASQLRTELSRLYAVASRLGEDLDAPHLRRLLQMLEVRRERGAGTRSDPIGRTDAEELVGAWLAKQNVENAWELAPRLAESGMKPADLQEFTDGLAPEAIGDALRWVGGIMSVESLIETLDVSAERISELVDAVKTYAYMDRAPSQEIDIVDGIESTLIILRHRLERIALHREYVPDLPRIWAHGNELNQVWTNLLANAIDALDGEGNIWIRAEAEDDALSVEIADDGPGIPEAVQSRMFEPFFTTKDTRHAAGLGLDIVYSIVVRHHSGVVHVNSKPGDTRFRVVLPLRKAATVEADDLRPVSVERQA